MRERVDHLIPTTTTYTQLIFQQAILMTKVFDHKVEAPFCPNVHVTAFFGQYEVENLE